MLFVIMLNFYALKNIINNPVKWKGDLFKTTPKNSK
jgi:hypothetical protein